jgi:MFS family permease
MAAFTKILHNRSLVTIGLAETVSNIGNWITMMAVFAMVVFRGDGSVAESSGIFLAGLLPTLLFSPVAGWLLDRFDRKWLMVGSELLSGLIISGLIFVSRLELVYALLALQAISTSLMTPARQAIVPDLVQREDLTRANAFFQQLAGLIKIGAPMLAGLILTFMNPHTAIILDVISFGLSALILSRLPALPPHPVSMPAVSQPSAQGKNQPSEGVFSVLNSSAALRLLFLTIFLGITVIIGFDVLSSIFIRDILQGNEQLYGVLIGLVGLGTLASAALLMLRREAGSPWKDMIGGILLLTCVPGAMALAAWLPDPRVGRILVISGALLGGIGNGFVTVQAGTLLQLYSPASVLGRMGGVFQSTAVAGQLIGIVITPLLVPGVLSMGLFFAISSLALLILAFYTIFISQKAYYSTEVVSAP